MNTTQKVMRNPLPTGFMRGGWSCLSKTANAVVPFSWPATRFVCPGYTARGVEHECGVIFDSYTGTTQRCQKCRPLHKREYQRLNKKKRRASGKSLR